MHDEIGYRHQQEHAFIAYRLAHPSSQQPAQRGDLKRNAKDGHHASEHGLFRSRLQYSRHARDPGGMLATHQCHGR